VEAVTLVEFLRARLDEDEQVASMAAGPIGHRWQPNPAGGLSGRDGPMRVHLEDRQCLPHIARHDPARVLAEVAAKRAIVKEFEVAQSEYPSAYAGGLETAVRFLATVYADHPDYDPAWQPAEVTT
jgi:hypothetical protein